MPEHANSRDGSEDFRFNGRCQMDRSMLSRGIKKDGDGGEIARPPQASLL